jgi:UDP-N-acetylglucosamine--N-acetylmuramyl-(pentapeptide) pyrophosphoryl-undecaprenol N-acetylglucosamine transferase
MWAHLVVARAGASTVGEIAVAGRPAVLVPLRIALDDDQGQNARLLSEPGAAVIAPEAELSAGALADLLAALLGDPDRLAQMATSARAVAKPDAAERLADVIERAAP